MSLIIIKPENLGVAKRPYCNLLAKGVSSKAKAVREFSAYMLALGRTKTLERVGKIVETNKGKTGDEKYANAKSSIAWAYSLKLEANAMLYGTKRELL